MTETNLDIKVTFIKGWWNARLLNKDTGKEIDHMRCNDKRDIGYMCREMLRWFSKCGGYSKWAESARRRHNLSKNRIKFGTIQKVWIHAEELSNNGRRHSYT